jgi:hypothetical protein
MKYQEARIGMQVMVAGEVPAEIDGLDDDLKLIHTKPLEDDAMFTAVGYHEVEGWRQDWQLDQQ